MAESFEDLLELAGSSGLWQLRIFLLAVFAGIPAAIQDFLHVFIAATPKHWCHVSPCGEHSYSEMKNLTIPLVTVEDVQDFAQCERIDYTLDQLSDNETCHVNPWGNQTVRCSQFDYDRREFHETIVTEWNLVCDREIWVSSSQAIYFIGGIIGCFVLGVISDKFGRKTAIMISVTLSVISGPFAALSPSFEIFLVARFLLSIGSSPVFGLSDVLVLEVVGRKWRGVAGCLFEGTYGFGYASTAIFAYFFRDWRHLQLAVLVPMFIFLIMISFVDESPRWLITQGNAKKAEKILRGIARSNGKEENLPDNFSVLVYELAAKESGAVPNQKSSNQKSATCLEQCLSLVRTPKMRRRSLALFFCWSTVALVYNGGSFNGDNLSVNLFLYILVNGLLDIPGCLLLSPLIKHLGRRPVFSGMFFLTATTLTTSLFFHQGSLIVIALAWIGIGLSMGAGYSMVYVYGSEILPTTVRAFGIGVAALLGKIGAVCGLYMSAELGKIHKMLPTLTLGVISLVAGCVALTLPETNKKRMPETVNDVENS